MIAQFAVQDQRNWVEKWLEIMPPAIHWRFLPRAGHWTSTGDP